MKSSNKYNNIKTTNNRPYNKDYISYIERSLLSRGFTNKQTSVILGNIIEESGGDPFAKSKNGTYQGLLQWAKDRYVIPSKSNDPYKEIDNQIDYLFNSIQNSKDQVSWTHGGSGSGYNKGIDAKNEFFNDSNDIDKIHRAFSYGYVRPKGKEDSYSNRLKVVKQVDDIRTNNFSDDIIKPLIYRRLELTNNNDYNMSRASKLIKGRRKKYDFGGVQSNDYYNYLIASKNNRNLYEASGVGIKSNKLDDAYKSGDINLNAKGKAEALSLLNNDELIYSNMQNKINSEILQARGITSQAKFGGLVGLRRKKYYWGGSNNSNTGTISYGTEILPSDIPESEYSAKGEGIVGSSAIAGSTTGLGVGSAVGMTTSAIAGGAASGTLLGTWAGPIGMGIGALLGGIIGLFSGRKKRREEEKRRQELLAAQKEANRQNTIGNMQNKIENDVATIRQTSLGNYSEGTGFYAKMGGMIGRRRLAIGGQVVPNSLNTGVAYGQTHEQYNPLTGETGILYNDAEIEGGGVHNGKAYAGEVVRQTAYGDQIFSDTLKVPGTKNTFADYAKKLTDMKGQKEKDVIRLSENVTLKLNELDRTKTNKLVTGRKVRDIEKLVYKMNKARGEAEKLDYDTEKLFLGQELYAEGLGLRNNDTMMRFGGLRRKMPYGGVSAAASSGYGVYKPYSLNTPSAKSFNFRTKSNPSFGANEVGLGINLLGSVLGIVGNSLNNRANQKALEWESSLSVPKQNKVEAVQYSTDYDIGQELQDLITQERRVARYINDNTSNVQTARNTISKLAIDAQSARNKLYAQKKDYQNQKYDMNIQARVNANNYNNRIAYEDALNEYNKAVQLNSAMMGIRTQGLQGILNGIDSISSAFNNYTQGRLYEKLWADGVRREMRTLALGGMVRRKRA